MQITLIRHLPTDWNKKTKLQGRKDIPISPIILEDQIQITKNLKRLKKLPQPDMILASTLSRTMQTANAYGFTAQVDTLLDELDFGTFEGRPKSLLMEMLGDQWLEEPLQVELGEKLTQLQQRVYLFLKKYQTYTHVLVFGHGAWIRALLSLIQTGNLNQMNKITLDNNQMITLSIDKSIKERKITF
ncbi:histidine phosphatase family protein [Caldibacillus lycopersici]|uniref:Histidine phosphatase family protein n=1 Tax=Perspicuibacillus lycopersici TaxID=1325689 RepID=A0AAE3IU88_9BACI|nr:histidine phosphatase family protein [Perspicuibacillus lycopersici]MCU9614735.1 histidine phosphatase family protein [Perspicuibacillus lycopersici]